MIDLVRDVDIGAEIQSYDPVEEEDLDDRTFPSFPVSHTANSAHIAQKTDSIHTTFNRLRVC